MKNKRSNWRPTLLCFSRESYTCPWWKTGGLTVPALPHPTPGRDDKQLSSGRTAFLGSHSKLRGFISLLHPNLGAVDSSYLTLSNSGFLLRLNSASQLPLQELEMLAQPFSPRDPQRVRPGTHSACCAWSGLASLQGMRSSGGWYHPHKAKEIIMHVILCVLPFRWGTPIPIKYPMYLIMTCIIH